MKRALSRSYEEEKEQETPPSISKIMTATHRLVQKKFKREPFSAHELYVHFLKTNYVYSTYRDVPRLHRRFDKLIAKERQYILVQVYECVWKNAAVVYMCLHQHGLVLPREIWHIIIQQALVQKQDEMMQFAQRVFHGTVLFYEQMAFDRQK